VRACAQPAFAGHDDGGAVPAPVEAVIPQRIFGLPTFIGKDLDALRAAARANFGLFTGLPFFQRLLRAIGFDTEADKAEQGVGGDALSDRVLDAICLLGPVERCRDRIAAYREAGLDLPIIWPALGIESARDAIAAFAG